MGIEAIGARVLRKEDKRFITGAGRYTDDQKAAGQHTAVFVRSPNAHAKIKKINIREAAKMPGVAGIFDGKQLTGDGIGNIICGWMVHSKDGSPMNMGAWSALATEYVRYVGDAVAVVIAETPEQARAAAEAVEVDYKVLPAVISAVSVPRRRHAHHGRAATRRRQPPPPWNRPTAVRRRACPTAKACGSRS